MPGMPPGVLTVCVRVSVGVWCVVGFVTSVILLVVVVERKGEDGIGREHQGRFIDVKVSVLGVIGLGSLLLIVFLVVNSFSAFACLVTRLLAIATGFRGAIAGWSMLGFAFPFSFVVGALGFAFLCLYHDGRGNVSLCCPYVVLDVGYDFSLFLYHNLVSPVAEQW